MPSLASIDVPSKQRLPVGNERCSSTSFSSFCCAGSSVLNLVMNAAFLPVLYEHFTMARRTFRRARRSRPRRRRFRRNRGRMSMRLPRLDPELKNIPNDESVLVDNGGLLFPLNLIAQGDDNDECVGRQFMVTSVQANFIVRSQPDLIAAAFPTSIRIALVLDKFPNGTIISVPGDIFTNVGGVNAPLGTRVIGQARRYKVLWSRLITLGPGEPIKHLRLFKKMRIRVRKSGVTNQIVDVQAGLLYMYVVSEVAAGGAGQPNFQMVVSTRFVG